MTVINNHIELRHEIERLEAITAVKEQALRQQFTEYVEQFAAPPAITPELVSPTDITGTMEGKPSVSAVIKTIAGLFLRKIFNAAAKVAERSIDKWIDGMSASINKRPQPTLPGKHTLPKAIIYTNTSLQEGEEN